MPENEALMDDEPGGGGRDGLAGYEYQVDVSVWLALDLLLANPQTLEITLEPASQEDIEAELDETEPGRVTSSAAVGGYTLVVQVKRRTGDAWTLPGVKALLKHGSDTRPSAARRLALPKVRYLLVTSAALNGGTRKLKVGRPGKWPAPSDMPATIAKALPSDAAGRVGIVGGMDEERLAGDVKRLLTERFRVPNARWLECLKALREEVRLRILSGGSGRWRREELAAVIHSHDGYLASTPELERYVHPTNWRDLRAAMRTRHAALIIGQSGTGKTLATRKLYEELRAEIPGLAHVPIRQGPQQLRDDRTTPPVLYDIEDPWGRFDFHPDSRPWNDQLDGLLAKATHDRMIVATSRRDVARESGALQAVEAWLVNLEAEHYGPRERARLYRTRVDDLPRDLQLVAGQAQAQVLAELATPLEIQKFFDALRTLDRDGLRNPPKFIAEAIRRAHQDSIERTVVEQIEERGDVRAAAVLWALMAASDKLSVQILRTVEELMADKEDAMSEGVTPLIDFFVAARNLRSGEGVVTYYHPRVEAGIVRTLERHSLIVRRTLKHLVDALLAPDGPGEAWGAGAAARLLAALHRLPTLIIRPTSSAAAKIDTWLRDRLLEGGPKFAEVLKLAAAAGSPESNSAELARYLLHRPAKPGPWWAFRDWEPPEKDAAWYARLHADPDTKVLLETFIRLVLPTDRVGYHGDLLACLDRLASDLTPAYFAAADVAVHAGVIRTDDVIAQGALRDLDGFERIVDAAVDELTPSDAERAAHAAIHLSIINEVYNQDYAEHLSESEEGYTAGVFLAAYTARSRKTRGWRVLAEHRHRDHLLSYWLRDLAEDVKHQAVDAEELAGAFAAGHGSADEEDLWFILLRSWDNGYEQRLRSRVHDGHPEPKVCKAALVCLIECLPSYLAGISNELIASDRNSRLVEIALDLADLRDCRAGDAEEHGTAAAAALASLPSAYAELSEAELALANDQVPALSALARKELAAIEDSSEVVRHFRVRMSEHVELPVDEDIQWLLVNSDDHNVATDAIEAAVRRGMVTLVEAALDHKFAQVSARALTFLGRDLALPLPTRLLSKAHDKARPTKRALVELLARRPHPDHLQALIQLAKDTWSKSSRYHDEEDDFPIAKEAVRALEALAPLSQTAAEELYSIAIDASDQDLRTSVFELLAKTAGVEWQVRLLDLAIAPGRAAVRRAAAVGLLRAREVAAQEVIDRITPALLKTQASGVAATMALLVASTAEPEAVHEIAQVIATDRKRRVLIVALIWVMVDRDVDTARRLAELLPPDHPATTWAFSRAPGELSDAQIADLGDPGTCAEVVRWTRQS